MDFQRPISSAVQARAHRFQPVGEFLVSPGSWDLVAMWSVFEHLLDWESTLATLAGAIEPGGYLLIETPRADPLAPLLREAWSHFLPTQHLQLASRRALTDAVSALGLTVLSATSFGANVPAELVPDPYKTVSDIIAKQYDIGSTQTLLAQKA